MLVLALMLGAIVGSFLNVVIARLPSNESIIFPSSKCPHCQAGIRWYDNIPLLSFILLGAKCRHCRAMISWQYPVVELAMALLSAALFKKFGLSVPCALYFVFCAALLAVIFIDLHHQIIPDSISLPGIIIGFGAAFINPLITWQQAGLGVLLGGGALYAVAAGYFLITKRDGMGGGDIKLLAMIGAFLGWQSLPFVIFASSLLGSIAGIGAMLKQKRGGKTVLPFGPFLSLAALVFLFFQVQINQAFEWYLSFMG